MMLLTRLALGAVLLTVTSCSETEWARVFGQAGDRKPFPLDIRLNRDSMTSISGNPGPDTPSSCFRRSVNFHDFSVKLVAMKDVDRKTCSVKPTDESYIGVKSMIEKFRAGEQHVIKQRTEHWIRPSTSLQPDEIVQTVGSKIAEFCRDYDTYLLVPDKTNSDYLGLTRRYVEDGMFRKCNNVCVFCIVSVQDEPKQ